MNVLGIFEPGLCESKFDDLNYVATDSLQGTNVTVSADTSDLSLA